jgi:hypothetical protein
MWLPGGKMEVLPGTASCTTSLDAMSQSWRWIRGQSSFGFLGLDSFGILASTPGFVAHSRSNEVLECRLNIFNGAGTIDLW